MSLSSVKKNLRLFAQLQLEYIITSERKHRLQTEIEKFSLLTSNILLRLLTWMQCSRNALDGACMLYFLWGYSLTTKKSSHLLDFGSLHYLCSVSCILEYNTSNSCIIFNYIKISKFIIPFSCSLDIFVVSNSL